MLILALAVLAPVTASATEYTILDLGTLGGGMSSASGINASGQVVGVSTISGNAAVHAFRTDANSPLTAGSDLGTLIGNTSQAFGINDKGQVVGQGQAGGYAFRTDANGKITATNDLGNLGGAISYAYGINASGQAVGFSNTTGNAAQHAFRTSPNGAITPASDLSAASTTGTYSYAYGVNASGQAVGYSYNIVDTLMHAHAFRTAPDGLIVAASDLGTLGGSSSHGSGINDAGQAVGVSLITGDAANHAFRTAPNGPIAAASDLGTLGGTFSEAFGINNSGQVVGAASVLDSRQHAFFSDVTGPMQDLNSLIPAHSGWLLTDAAGINDSGQVAGTGTIGGQTHAFLLTPTSVPEPSVLSLLGLGCFGLLARRPRPGMRAVTACQPPRSESQPLQVSSCGIRAAVHLSLGVLATLFAASASRADIIYASGDNDTIEKFTPNGMHSVFSNTGLSDPLGLAFDGAGNLYAANGGTRTIEKFTPDGVASVFANTGSNTPCCLAFDGSGNLYVGTNDNDRSGIIEKFTPGGVGSVFASSLNPANGPPYWLSPSALAFDRAGNLFESDYNAGIARFTPGGIASIFAGIDFNGRPYDEGTVPSLFGPTPDVLGQTGGLAFDRAGNLYVANSSWYRGGWIEKYTPDGANSLFAYAHGPGLGSGAGLAVDSTGTLYASEGGVIGQFTPDGVGSEFAFSSDLNFPSFIAIQPGSIPEPSALSLLGLNCVGMLLRRRHLPLRKQLNSKK